MFVDNVIETHDELMEQHTEQPTTSSKGKRTTRRNYRTLNEGNFEC